MLECADSTDGEHTSVVRRGRLARCSSTMMARDCLAVLFSKCCRVRSAGTEFFCESEAKKVDFSCY